MCGSDTSDFRLSAFHPNRTQGVMSAFDPTDIRRFGLVLIRGARSGAGAVGLQLGLALGAEVGRRPLWSATAPEEARR